MTIRTIRVPVAESDRIASNEQMYVIRKGTEPYKRGDLLMFDVYKDGKSVMRKMSKNVYEVTYVMGCDNAPIHRGWQIIAFKMR